MLGIEVTHVSPLSAQTRGAGFLAKEKGIAERIAASAISHGHIAHRNALRIVSKEQRASWQWKLHY
jgi:hypothetical protein